MKCYNCGRELEPNAEICEYCGNRIGGLKGKFCKRCEIVLRSCYLGQSPWLEDRIRKETGCDVKLFKWSVNPILGNDWIEMFAREAPRVPTIGMPGMLPL